MSKKYLLLFAIILILSNYFDTICQEKDKITPSQTVRGKVVDFRNQMPLESVTVTIKELMIGNYTQRDGTFKIPSVPVGRYTLRVSSIGYETQILAIVVSSGKEVILNVELVESFISKDTVTVLANKDGSFVPINESALVSAAQFTVDDVERYAGSRMDPARMAQNFAGVLGANDSRNDIIIRGGSPTELLWRLDGLDIPNPNHFATQGATGGPIGAINSRVLDNSDFFTGAFPAEYGDRISGVFDLRTRQGNDEKWEKIFQFGFNGFEAGIEGPIGNLFGGNSKDASFIANYRYSFLDLMEKMGIDFGFSGIPRYQDGTLKLDIKANDYNTISITGLFGISDIFLDDSKEDDVATGDENTKNGTDFFSIGAVWKHLISDNFYGKLILGTVYGNYRTDVDSITTGGNHNVTDISKWYSHSAIEGYNTAKYEAYYSPLKSLFITAGVEARFKYFDFNLQRYTVEKDDSTLFKLLKDGSGFQWLSFIDVNLRLTDDFKMSFGIHSQYFDLTKETTVEPRFGASYQIFPQHTLTFGFGIHRQSLPLLLYYSEPINMNLKLMESVHYVAGYSFNISEDAIFKIEGYLKNIKNVPVRANKNDYWSFLNAGANFGSIDYWEKCKSTGEGRCYGAELSLFKHFSDGYYLTATGSYVRQEFSGSDGNWHWGAFDNQFILNLLAGYEWKFSANHSLEFSCKYTLAGGGAYTPIDEVKSKIENDKEYLDSAAFSLHNPNYSRFDIKIDSRFNYSDWSIICYFSIENLFNTKNILKRQWDTNEQAVTIKEQIGLFPVGGIRIEF
ncbi:MAG TPA: TonB-dependent receptor [Candidatus Kapabacteria bacterium]|mgnify:CR=1 FL=1|nr:TonB-dependent receptor [Candidatus Kapabacteria bacterium]HPO63378.1 TonB-dependent receptor [Candidatus Kapabacteria bacterium]